MSKEYDTSIDNWKKEQINLIKILDLNILYLEKEIKLKQLQLKLHKKSLIHEKLILEKI